MAITKNARSLIASQSVNAGSSVSGMLDLTTALGALLTAKVTNEATAPTTPCVLTINTSGDGTNWKKYAQVEAGTENSEVYEWAIEIPPTVMHVQAVFDGHTDQSVTVECLAQELTSVS